MNTRDLPFYECKKGIYEIDEFGCVSVFVIVGTERALVFDTGTGTGNIRWLIENRITDKPYDIVLSHNHGGHAGGAGLFDSVWIHPMDSDWNNPCTVPEIVFRKKQAELMRLSEFRSNDVTDEEIVRPVIDEPLKKRLRDGMPFYLGGRTVTLYHCPGHTDGLCVAVDNLTRTMLISDACSTNLLLGSRAEHETRQIVRIARDSLNRLVSMHSLYGDIFNSHHTCRRFGEPLQPDILTDVLTCLEAVYEEKADFRTVPDVRSTTGGTKTVAVQNNVQISLMNQNIKYY